MLLNEMEFTKTANVFQVELPDFVCQQIPEEYRIDYSGRSARALKRVQRTGIAV